MIGKKGLFGKNPMVPAGEITYTPKAQAIMQGQAPMPPKQGGGWKDILMGALGGAADGAATFFGGQPLIAQQRQLQQLMAQRQQEAERQRAASLEDYRAKKGVDAEFAGQQGPEIGTFEDNAGNVWRFDKASGQVIGDRPMFVDPNERVYFQDGAMVRVPNRFGQGAPAQGGMKRVTNQQDYDALQPGEQYTDPNGNIRTKGGTAGNGGGSFRP